jgi:competence protein ComK
MNILMLYYDSAEQHTVLVGNDRHSFFAGRPEELLDEMCLRHGSSYEGRCTSFRHMLHVHQKAAVMISEISQSIYFPTHSPFNPQCVWLHYNEILSIQAKQSNTIVKFLNGFKIEVRAPYRTVRNQMKRCEEYLCQLKGSGSAKDMERLRQMIKES